MELNTKENKYDKMIANGLKEQKKYVDMTKEIEELYDGDYTPLMGGRARKMRVKTYMMSTAIDTSVAMIMPPPNFEFIVVPANKEQEPDINSAKTAKSWCDYYIHKHGGYGRLIDCAYDYRLLNRAIVRVNYRNNPGAGGMHQKAIYSEGGEKQPGQAFFEKIHPKDFLRAPGFKTIREAEVPGGWVAYRVCVHKDWVKNNAAFKEYAEANSQSEWLKELNGDVKNPSQPADPDKREEGKAEGEDCDYNYLWYIYEYKTDEKPKGCFTAFSKLQKKILYSVDNYKEFKGMDFPFFEVVDAYPRRGTYAIPKPYRAKNAQLRAEYYETRLLKLTRDSKAVVALGESMKDEQANKFMNNDDAIVVIESENQVPKDGMYNFDIKFDTQGAEMGRMQAKANFEAILGPNLTDPRMGDKIATEMVLQNKLFITETNRHIINFNKFIEEIATALVKITNQKVSQEEQVRMSRSVEQTWVDDEEITQSGDYVITVKGSPLYDMTEGDRSKLLHMVIQALSALSQTPQWANRIDFTPILKSWLEMLGVPFAGVIKDIMDMDQATETSLMMARVYQQVEPTDNHVEHLKSMQEFESFLGEAGMQLDEEEQPLFVKHAMEHMKYLQEQQQGAAGMNPTNAMRQAGAETLGSQGMATLPTEGGL